MKIEISGKPYWVNYHHLHCFYVIAREGSLAAASKKLGIGLSALSIQLKQFEESLETRLFERSHKKLTLNEHGRLLLAYATEIFRLGGEMIEALKDRPASGRTHLQVGALDTIPKHLTLRLAETALAQHKCTISILEGKPKELLNLLLDHKIDLLLTNVIPSGFPGRTNYKRIARLPLWIVGNKSFQPLKKTFPKSLERQPFVVPTTDSSVRNEIDNFFRKQKIEPDIVAEAQDVMIQKLLALDGFGMTIVPEFAIHEYLVDHRLHLIGKLGDCCEELYLVSGTRRIENPVAASLFKGFAIKAI